MAKYEENISLRFIGEQLDSHTMDVRLLAPALLAFADVLKATQEVVNPRASSPAIEIRATGEGSFIIELVSTTSFIDSIIGVFDSDQVNAGLNCIEIGAVAFGAVKLIVTLFKKGKNLRRKKLKSGEVKLVWADGSDFITSEEVINVAQNVVFRKNLRGFVEPLECEGVDSVEISGDKFEPVSISKTDVPAFVLDTGLEEVSSEITRRVVLQIVQLTLQGDYRWRFSDGSSTFTALMADEDFKERISSRSVRFAEGDQLEVEVTERQVIKGDGSLRYDREIIRVFKHLPAPEQMVFLFDDEADE